MKTLKKLMTRSTHVKPLVANQSDTQWLVTTCTPLEAFIDEVFRYGVSVAWYNLKVQLKS